MGIDQLWVTYYASQRCQRVVEQRFTRCEAWGIFQWVLSSVIGMTLNILRYFIRVHSVFRVNGGSEDVKRQFYGRVVCTLRVEGYVFGFSEGEDFRFIKFYSKVGHSSCCGELVGVKR